MRLETLRLMCRAESSNEKGSFTLRRETFHIMPEYLDRVNSVAMVCVRLCGLVPFLHYS